MESIRQDLEWTKRNILSLERNNNLMFVVSTSFIIVLLSAFLLTWFGFVDLRIVGQIEFNYTIEYIGNLLMFIINMFFIFSISLLIFDKRIIFLLLYYIPICLIITTLGYGQTLLFTTIAPIIYILFVSCFIYKHNILHILKRLLFLIFFVFIYQQLSGYIKLMNFSFTYYKCNILTMFIYSIDLYLFYSLIYKVVKDYAGRQIPFWQFGFLKSFCKEILNVGIKEDTADLTIRQRRIFFLLVWSYLIMQSFLIVGINVLMNQILYYMGSFYIGVIELLIMWVVLEFSRLALGRTYHNKNPIICNAISLGVFFLMSRLAIPLRYSLFFNICIAAAIAIVIHILVIRNDEYKELFIFKERITKFNLKTCTKDELIERCRLKGLSKDDTELCIGLFIDRLKIYELASKYYITEQSMKNKKYKLIKLLNSTF